MPASGLRRAVAQWRIKNPRSGRSMRVMTVLACGAMLTCLSVPAATKLGSPGDPADPGEIPICRSGGDARLSVTALDTAIAEFKKIGYDDAIADYSEAIRREPTAGLYVARGLVWQVREEYDRAIADYSEAARLGDPTAETHVRIAEGLKQRQAR